MKKPIEEQNTFFMLLVKVLINHMIFTTAKDILTNMAFIIVIIQGIWFTLRIKMVITFPRIENSINVQSRLLN